MVNTFRTCVLSPCERYALVFDQEYTYQPCNPKDGLAFKEIHLCGVRPIACTDVETGIPLPMESPVVVPTSTWIQLIKDAEPDLKGQAFVHYWGRHEPQS